jgi:hypothetical protein
MLVVQNIVQSVNIYYTVTHLIKNGKVNVKGIIMIRSNEKILAIYGKRKI